MHVERMHDTATHHQRPHAIGPVLREGAIAAREMTEQLIATAMKRRVGDCFETFRTRLCCIALIGCLIRVHLFWHPWNPRRRSIEDAFVEDRLKRCVSCCLLNVDLQLLFGAFVVFVFGLSQ